MIEARYDDWKAIVDHHTDLLKHDVDEAWLGGFSTGGNLVTSHALVDDDIKGLLLFSPGFVSDEGGLFLTPLLSTFRTWAFENDSSGNYLRYESFAMNAAALYYRSMSDVQDKLDDHDFDKPVLVTMSEHDSVLDPNATADIFKKHFTHPASRMIWYGSKPEVPDSRTIYLTTDLPEQRISNFSHLSVLFSPDNPFYGRDGSYRMLGNGQDMPREEANLDELWFSAWGTRKPGIYHARLTWNPYFDHLEEMITRITATPAH